MSGDMEKKSHTAIILFLLADTGAGHRSAANAIQHALHIGMPEATIDADPNTDYHSVSIDAFATCGLWPLRKLSTIYGLTIRYTPWLYSLLFHLTNHKGLFKVLEGLLYRLIHRRLADLFTRLHPDVIVSVHPLLNHVSLRVLAELQMPVSFVTVITDLITPHRAWMAPSVSECIVPTEMARDCCRHQGIANEHIKVLGMPIDLKFSRRYGSKALVREKMGLNPALPTVLLVGGGEGAGSIEKLVRALGQAALPIQLVIVAGRNKRLQRRLGRLVQHFPELLQRHYRILGFVQNMDELMQAADVLVTKAGPSTICEAIASQVPIILSSFIPGQEEGNVHYVCNQGIGMVAETPEQVISLLRQCFEPDSPLLDRVRMNMARLQNPFTALAIATCILSHLPQKAVASPSAPDDYGAMFCQ